MVLSHKNRHDGIELILLTFSHTEAKSKTATMQLINLTYLTAALATISSAIPDPGRADISEPDPRFAHLDLPHPNAEIHVPHPKALSMRDSSINKRTPPPPVYGTFSPFLKSP